MTTKKPKALALKDPEAEARYFRRVKTYQRRPGDADVDATERTMKATMRAHARATVRVLADDHETPPGPDWRADELAAWIDARALLRGAS